MDTVSRKALIGSEKLLNWLMELYDDTGDRAEKYAYGRVEQEILSGRFDIPFSESEGEALKAINDITEKYLHKHEEVERLEQKLKDYEGCKGIEDYYRVLCDLRETEKENRRLQRHIADLDKALSSTSETAVQPIARTLDEWHEDFGDVLWWNFPIVEPPHVGTPLDSEWRDHYTHWTSITIPGIKDGRDKE